MSPHVLTVGHSSRTAEAFLGLLFAHRVAGIVDVRRVPESRRHPHFGQAALAGALVRAGMTYDHRPGLGGRREPDRGDANAGLADAAFRGFADYMQTASFEREIAALIGEASGVRLALLCAEADPSRCHRSLIADTLVARGARVEHILDAERLAAHIPRPEARVIGTRVTYPARQTTMGLQHRRTLPSRRRAATHERQVTALATR